MSVWPAGRKLSAKRVPTIGVLLLALAACDLSPGTAEAPASREPATIDISNSPEPVASNSGHGASQPVPSQLVGEWKAVSEKCDPDFDEKPSKHIDPATLHLTVDGHYRKRDWNGDSSGSFTVSTIGGQLAAMLDNAGNLMHFTLVDGHLENWGEGEAVYPCAPVFARVK